jgi:hypothetical protein
MMPICSETSEKSLVSSYHHIISAIGELKKKRSADIRMKNAEKSLRNNNQRRSYSSSPTYSDELPEPESIIDRNVNLVPNFRLYDAEKRK